MSMLDYTPLGIIGNSVGNDSSDDVNSAESCLERVDNLSIDKPCCSACGHGMADEDPVLTAGSDCPLCGGSGTVADGSAMAQQIKENAHEYWGE